MDQKELTNLLAEASEIYYKGNGKSTILTDTEFDLKLHELMSMEKESGIVYPNSPTQRVGSDALTSFKKGKHPYPMLTIENTYDDKGFEEWVNKIHNEYDCDDFNVSVKYDGVSCELHYSDGFLVQALTRGDKNEGDDITENVKTINSVPLFIESVRGWDFYVRGEILMPKSQLEKLNENLDKPFANTRNACSGSIKLLDSKLVAKRGLIFRAWDCFYTNRIKKDFSTMEDKAIFLNNIGFVYEKDTLPFYSNYLSVINDVVSFKKKLDEMNLDYDYDGVVVKIDDVDTQRKIGTKDTRAIEWGIARKWNEDYVVWTELQGVEWSVGNMGAVTPVGILDPVECGGVIISNVTLHNAANVENLELHLGNELKITRSGGVIPDVLEVKHDLLMEMNGAYKKVEIPEFCPVCGAKLVREGPILKCVNDDCPAIIKGKLLRFCSKDCCDIKSIGESVISDLVDKNLVTSISDILFIGSAVSNDSMRRSILTKFVRILGRGYGIKSIDKMLEAIEYAHDNITYDRLLNGLSIPSVGKVMARTLSKHYTSVYELLKCTKEELCKIDGIAEAIADDIYDWTHSEEGIQILEDIDTYGWKFCCEIEKETAKNAVNKPLEGLTICFSGKSSRFSGDEVETFLEEKGAKCTHSVSKSLNYLIVGEKPGGSKVQKANDYGIKIITEVEFFNKFNI